MGAVVWGMAPCVRLSSASCSFPQSRLRRQDTGLKTHLEQLGQQISELQLDMCRSSSEAVDSDSRPSSGTLHVPRQQVARAEFEK